jgi:hypothetical protein
MFTKIVLNKETVFCFFSLSGSVILVIQLILNLFGLSHHYDIGDTDIGTGEIDTSNFKWLSKQALSGFFMMFGWVGLSCLKEFEFNVLLSSAIAFIAGVLAMFVSGFIFKMAGKLHSPGTVFKIEDAIGLEAIIYYRILKKDKGRVSISINNLTREIDAIALNEEEIPSFTKVKIINKVDENTVSVVPVKIGDL